MNYKVSMSKIKKEKHANKIQKEVDLSKLIKYSNKNKS
jgi:hypothetical protein